MQRIYFVFELFFARMRFNFSWLFLAKSKNTLEIIIETVTLTKAECVWIVPGLTGLKCRYLMILSEMSSHLQFMRQRYLLCVTSMEKSCEEWTNTSIHVNIDQFKKSADGMQDCLIQNQTLAYFLLYLEWKSSKKLCECHLCIHYSLCISV